MTNLTYPKDKVCADCGEPAVVGYGQTPVWLCQTDFELRLREVRTAIRTGLAALDR